MSTGIEIEKRTLPNPEQRQAMINLMRENADFKEFERIMIENASLDRTQTLRVRIDDGVASIAIKDGTLDQEIRSEAELHLAKTQPLEDVLHFMALLGHPTVSVGRRHVFSATVDNLRLSLRDILSVDGTTNHGCMMEVEAQMGNGETEGEAMQRIQAFLAKHGLSPLEGEAWMQWVEHNHSTIHSDFSYSPEAAKALADSL